MIRVLTITGFIILLCFSFVGFSQVDDINLNSNLIRDDYSFKLYRLFNIITNENVIDDSLLLFSCPLTQVEYLNLYQYTHPDTSKVIQAAYYKRKNLICKKLREGNIDFLNRQMILSVFIDGEEAEGFFEDLENYYYLNPVSFCNAYQNLIISGRNEDFKRLRKLNIDCLKNE